MPTPLFTHRHYQDCIARAAAYGFTGFADALRYLHALDYGLPLPEPTPPAPSYMPKPGTPEGDALVAYYDRPGYKGD